MGGGVASLPFSDQALVPPCPFRPHSGCVCCGAGQVVDPLTETMAPEIRNSTDFALEERRPAGPAATVTTLITLFPAAPGGKQVSHSPTSAPPTPWEEDLAPQMSFSMDSTPMATEVTPAGLWPWAQRPQAHGSKAPWLS